MSLKPLYLPLIKHKSKDTGIHKKEVIAQYLSKIISLGKLKRFVLVGKKQKYKVSCSAGQCVSSVFVSDFARTYILLGYSELTCQSSPTVCEVNIDTYLLHYMASYPRRS
jgi:hypothetical protein